MPSFSRCGFTPVVLSPCGACSGVLFSFALVIIIGGQVVRSSPSWPPHVIFGSALQRWRWAYRKEGDGKPLAVTTQRGHLGAVQVFFGIKGRRWEKHDFISRLWNENWVYPSEEETPGGAMNVERGCYWG